MPSWTRRWPTRHVEPEESDNIRRARDRALADAVRASGAPRIAAWGRHDDPVKGLPVVGIIIDPQPDTAAVWAWKRQNGVAWDDSERKGAIPARRRSGGDASSMAAPGDLVDPAKVLHRRWRQHDLALDEHAYRAYRRRLRETSWRSLSAPATPKVGKPKTWQRFDPTSHLTSEGQARYEAERWLDKVLAHHIQVFKEPLRPWAAGRAGRGAWVPPPLPAARSVSADAFERLFARKPDGRPPDHDPRLVALALYLAEGIYHQLEQGIAGDESFALAAIEGCWRDRWPPEGIALALRAAASTEITVERIDFKVPPDATTPRSPSLVEIEEIVARLGYGRPGACRALAFEIAALAYNLPRKALEAMVKRTK